MTYRITTEILLRAVDQINTVANTPSKTWVKDGGGQLKAQVGNYYLEGAYGGHRLAQIISEGGGIKAITQGFVSKRELHDLLIAYRDGMTASKTKPLL